MIKVSDSSSKNNCKYLKKINADFFIKDFIEEYCKKKNTEKRTYISALLFFTIAGILFIIGWIYHLYYNIMLKEDYKAKVLRLNKKRNISVKIKVHKKDNNDANKIYYNENGRNNIHIMDAIIETKMTDKKLEV